MQKKKSEESQNQSIASGIELCNQTFALLKKEKLHPSIQTIVNSGENDFPYNILISNNPSDESDRLIFTFNMKEARNYLDLVVELGNLLKEQEFNSTILLCYEEQYFFMGFLLPNSTSVFVNSLDTNDNNIVYNINFNSDVNTVISGTRGYTSPSWMVKQVNESFYSQEIDFKFPFLFLSQLSKVRFEMNRTLSTFLQNDISAVTITFKQQQEHEDDIKKILEYYVMDFEQAKNNLKDYHYLMLNFFNRRIWFSEAGIINIVVIFILVSLAFLFILGYINFNLQNKAWIELKSNWYTIIVTYFLSVIGFYTGKWLFTLFHKNSFQNSTIFGIIVWEITFAITYVSIFFVLEMFIHKKRYSGKSISLLLLLITFINQFIFCFSDVSLFPIFFLIFILSIFCFIFDKSWINVILMILTFGIFIVYASILTDNSNPENLRIFLITSKNIPFIFSLFLLPLYMMWLRIITEIRTQFEKSKIAVIVLGATYVFAIVTILLINVFYFSKYQSQSNFSKLLPVKNENNEYKINLSYKDDDIFGELIRTVHYHSETEPVIIRITIEGEELMPVLYSEYDYDIQSPKKIAVSIPVNPGKDVIFSYGAQKEKSIITADTIINSDNKNEYFQITNTIVTE